MNENIFMISLHISIIIVTLQIILIFNSKKYYYEKTMAIRNQFNAGGY